VKNAPAPKSKGAEKKKGLTTGREHTRVFTKKITADPKGTERETKKEFLKKSRSEREEKSDAF